MNFYRKDRKTTTQNMRIKINGHNSWPNGTQKKIYKFILNTLIFIRKFRAKLFHQIDPSKDNPQQQVHVFARRHFVF
jgi:hypothetical protein